MAQDGNIFPEEKKEEVSDEVSASLPRLRTYAQDMSRVIKTRGETVASIVNKEKISEAKDAEKEPSYPKPRTVALVLGGMLFFIAGVGALIGAFIFTPANETHVREIPAIIFANETVVITVDDAVEETLARARKEHQALLGNIVHFSMQSASGQSLTPTEVVRALNLPEELAREARDIMVGVHSFDRNQPFIIVRVSAYDRSFDALLKWEPSAARELGAFFEPQGNVSSAPRSVFSDIILQNLDVRTSGEAWPIIYTFPTQNLLIVTTNEFTLREIMTRLASSRISF